MRLPQGCKRPCRDPGTGYYWLEWLGQGEEGTLLLIEGERPLFADRKDVSGDERKCSEQKIVAELQVHRVGTRLMYDCHLTDDEPHPIGQLVVGFIDFGGPGLVKPLAAWQVVVLGQGEGGEIRAVDPSRVLCTVLPPID